MMNIENPIEMKVVCRGSVNIINAVSAIEISAIEKSITPLAKEKVSPS
jgi:hypothetical protein